MVNKLKQKLNWLLLISVLIGVTVACYKTTEYFYYRAYYAGCTDLAEDTLFNPQDSDYLLFKCNYNTKLIMFRHGYTDDIKIDTGSFPDLPTTR
jgi:hypothetical protein